MARLKIFLCAYFWRSIYLCMYLSIYLIYLSIYPSVCLSIILIRFEWKGVICMLLRVSCYCIHQAYFIYIFSEFCLNINKQKILNTNTKYSYKHQSILPFLFTLHNNNLFWCLHLLKSSDLLFNKLQSPRDLMTKNFSVKHNLQ